MSLFLSLLYVYEAWFSLRCLISVHVHGNRCSFYEAPFSSSAEQNFYILSSLLLPVKLRDFASLMSCGICPRIWYHVTATLIVTRKKCVFADFSRFWISSHTFHFRYFNEVSYVGLLTLYSTRSEIWPSLCCGQAVMHFEVLTCCMLLFGVQR